MCDPATLFAIGSTLAGGLVQHFQQNSAAHRADNAASQAIKNQRTYQDQANKVVNKAVDSVSSTNRADQEAKVTNTLDSVFSDAVNRASDQGALADSNTAAGNLSDAFTTAHAKAAADTRQAGLDRARTASQIAGANTSRLLQGFDIADTGAQLGEIGDFAHGQNTVDQLAIQNAGHTNPWIAAIGDALGAYGQGKLISGALTPKVALPAKMSTPGWQLGGLAGGY